MRRSSNSQLTAVRNVIRCFIAVSTFVLVFLTGATGNVHGADKNGVSPNTVSLPSGPGSIDGLGESFQPMLNTGSARYSVPISMPGGVAGNTPSLALSYDSGSGDSAASMGWRYGPGGISRQTDKGIPRYVDTANGLDDDHDNQIDEADELDRFVGVDGEELVAFANHVYRARIEGNFARYTKVGQGWEVELTSGATLYYGTSAASQITNASGTQIFRWLLAKSTDSNGNAIEYDYTSYAGSTNQKYLKQIRYAGGASPWSVFYFASFEYGDKPDWRKDYRSGFEVKTTKRLTGINMGIQGTQPQQSAPGDWNGDLTGDALISRYALDYDDNSAPISHLIKVTRFGSDGVNYLPPTSFSYSTVGVTVSASVAIDAQSATIGADNAPLSVMDSERVDLIDLNRDGLPDILKTEGGNHVVYRNLGEVQQGSSRAIKWSEPLQVQVIPASESALALRLNTDQISLADMNGDGISDLVNTSLSPASKDVSYFANDGNFGWGAKQPMSIKGNTAPPSQFSLNNVKSTDLDFNKQMDVVMSTDKGYTVWYNYRDGSYSRAVSTAGAREVTTSGNRVMQFTDTGFDFADMNGDRLNDATRIRPTHVIYAASKGHGNFADAINIAIPDQALTDTQTGQIKRAKLIDINGDGLADLVLERATANQLWFWLNLGTDTFSSKYTVENMPSQFSENTTVRWADLNGNGTTDLIYADSTAATRLRTFDIGVAAARYTHPYLLSRIDNGLGVITNISYQSSTEQYLQAQADDEAWTSTVPFPVSVVTKISTTTGLDVDSVPGLDEYKKHYVYRDGFYEDRERQFRGFKKVSVTELGDASAPTLITEHEFYTGGPDGIDNDNDGAIDEITTELYREEDALKGLVRSLESRSEAGTVFNRTENSWRVRNLLVNGQGTEVRYADMTQSEQFIYEGTTTPETIRTTYVYDDYGNTLEQKNYGAVSISGDEVFTFAEYINDTTNWLIGFPQRQYQTDAALVKASESFSYYDGADYTGLALGQIVKGNLTRQQSWVSGANTIDLLRSAYDSYGNIIGNRNANGFERNISYDPLLHIFPQQENIEIGNGNPDLSVTAEYNLGLGVVTSSVDFNGHQTDYGYDVFGRPSAIVGPSDSPALPTQSFIYSAADPANNLLYAYDSGGVLSLSSAVVTASSVQVKAREVSGQSGTLDIIQYVDGLGRELSSIEESDTGFVVTEAVVFNQRGSAHLRYLPYASASSEYVRPALTGNAYESHYDAMARSVLNINPEDAQGAVTSSAIAYQPLKTITTDENGISKAQLSDGRGRLIAVNEFNQGETYVTQYAYDTQNNMVSITDAQNNVKSMLYDGLSRKTQHNDIDRGQIQYQYDNAGNVLQTTDNKAQVIAYTYDGVNRLLSEDYLDSAAINPDVSYYYDSASSEHPGLTNIKGRLGWVEDLSGASFWSYDTRGNAVRTIKRISDGVAMPDHHFRMEYDAMSRVVATHFPDGDRLESVYDKRSQLQQIPGLVDAISYYPSGQKETTTYANGRVTQYDYDRLNRLTRLVTDVSTPSGNPIQDLSYGMDGANNILSIVDGRTQLDAPAANASQTFEYDDVYRLTQASGPGYGLIDYQYDAIGNMTFKSSPGASDTNHISDPLINLGAMTSGGSAGSSGRAIKGTAPGPHAITSTASGLVYEYDDNGNMIRHATGDVYQWDFKNRLINTTTASTTADYVYDYSGQRVIKKSRTGGTSSVDYYLGEGFELRDGKPVKFVFAGGQRIARLEGRLAETGQATTQQLNFKPGWNFFSLQVEPTDTAIATVLAPLDGNYTEIWAFDSVSQQYQGFIPSGGANALTDLTDIVAQRGYIIYVANGATLNVSGNRQTDSIDLQPGLNLIPSPADAPVDVQDALSTLANNYTGVWDYQTAPQTWREYLPNQPAFLSELASLQPDKAYWLDVPNAAQILFQEQEKKIFFYHADHLGSTNVVTDLAGDVVESTEFYPFGRTRHEHKNGFAADYQYTGKELDKETGLMYYEARYMDAVTGRFVSVDPLAVAPPESMLLNPQFIHAYAYAANNPVRFVDPEGLGPGESSSSDAPKEQKDPKTHYFTDDQGERQHGTMKKQSAGIMGHLTEGIKGYFGKIKNAYNSADKKAMAKAAAKTIVVKVVTTAVDVLLPGVGSAIVGGAQAVIAVRDDYENNGSAASAVAKGVASIVPGGNVLLAGSEKAAKLLYDKKNSSDSKSHIMSIHQEDGGSGHDAAVLME
jgi:RHS repeat-associated protein